jgi:hypothetical protein
VQRGFKTQCERTATSIRDELDLSAIEPLDPRALANHLEVPVHPISCLRGAGVAAAVRHVRSGERKVLSAMTIFPNYPRPHRVVLYNDANTPGRQNSDITHELAHGLLLHDPRHPIVSGCRDYNKAEEDEAAWLSGCLLIPRAAALHIARTGSPEHVAAEKYGVSADMVRFRVNATGARKQVARASRRWGRQSRRAANG